MAVMASLEKTKVHTFELAGLGIGPFTFVGEFDRGTRNHTTCDYCGTSIRYEEVIKDIKGKTFKVGNECVHKTGDVGLIDMVKKAEKERRQRQKAEKLALKLEGQRQKNGGLTDAEVKQQKWEAEEKLRKADQLKQEEMEKAAALEVNAEILRVMAPMVQSNIAYRQHCIDSIGGTYRVTEPFPAGTFMADMWQILHSRPHTTMTMRQKDVLASIVAKGNARAANKRKLDTFRAEIDKALEI